MSSMTYTDKFLQKIKLKNITLGEVSGENEADFVKDFEKLYYDFNSNSRKILLAKNFYLIGRKGTGKSLLARYIKHKHEKDATNFTEVISYRNFTYHELIQYRDDDFKSKEYFYIMKWFLLINIARLIVKDNSLSHHPQHENLRQFIENNFGYDLDQKKIIDSSKKIKFEGGLKGILKSSYEQSEKITVGCYLDYLDAFEDLLAKIAKNSENSYLIFYDDLDDRFGSDKLYLESMRSLIYAVDEVNRNLLRKGVNAKNILILL